MPDIANLQFKADTGDIKNATTALDQLAAAAVKTEKAADDVSKAVNNVGKGGSGSGLKVTKQDLDALLDKLNPTSKAFDDLDKSMRQLQSARSQKLIDTDQFSDYSKLVDQQRIALQKQYDSLTGYTAAQKQAAAESAAVAKAAAQEEAAAVKEAAAEATAARRQAAVEATAIYRQQQLAQREASAADSLAQRQGIADAATTQRQTIAETALAQRKAAADAVQAYREQQQAAAALAAAERQQQAAQQKQNAELDRLRAVLNPASAAAKVLQEQFTLLAKSRLSGAISSTEYVQLRQQLVQLNTVVKDSTLSAGQFKQGWQTAAFQLKDAFESLVSGGSPIRTLAQQLPTLLLSFGSVGATLGAFVSLINPFTVGITALVAGIGYLGYNAYQSATQLDTLQKALNATGNIAGTSAADLKALAAALADSTGNSVDTATKAVTIAASLSTTTTQLKQFAEAALVVSKSTGEGVEDILGQFKRLAADPVQALVSLNDQYNFANTALYDHVKALTEAGDKTAAMALVVDSLEQSTKQLAATTETSVGASTGFWGSLAASITGAWQSLKDYNAENSKNSYDGIGGKPAEKSYDPYGVTAAADDAKKSENNWASLNNIVGTTLTTLSQINQETKQFNTESVNANAEADKFLQSSRTNAQIRNDLTKQWSQQLKDGVISQSKFNALVDAANEKYKDPKTPKTPAVQVDAGDKLTEQYQAQNLALDAQIALLKNRSSYQANASQQQKDYLLLEAKYSVLEEAATTRQLTKQEQQTLAVKDEALAQAKTLAAKGDQLATLQRQAQVQDEITKLQQTQTATAAVYAANQGESTKELQRQLELAQTRAAVLAKGGTAQQANAAAQIKEIDFTQADARAADWVNGMKTGLADWADSATQYAKIASDAVQKGMDTASDAVSNFVITGKLNFADFTTTILKMIVEIITKLLVVQALKAGSSAVGLGSLFANAKGGVYDDPSLSRYSNGVYDSPQMFSFAGRTKFANGGVFAEAGPEAIMPLTRDSNGRLGVKAEGGGSGAGVGINQSVTINTNGTATTNTSTTGDSVGRALGDQMSAAALDVVRTAIKPGGLLYRWQKGVS